MSIKDKRGISAVVATVLIILITVAAISIIWVSVLPIVKENLESVSALNIDLTILKEGYTVYDEDKKIASVQVKRGDDEESLKKIKLVFYISGGSEYLIFDDVPEANSALVYLFNFSNLQWGIPDEISVAPILNINNKLVEGEISHRTKIELKKLNLNEEELEALEGQGSSSPNGSSGYSDEGDNEGGVCEDECSSGQTRCDGDSVQTCGDYDSDDCLEFGVGVDCEDGFACEDGSCKPQFPIVGNTIYECGALIDEPGTYELNADLHLSDEEIGGDIICIKVVTGDVEIGCNGNHIYFIEYFDSISRHGVYVDLLGGDGSVNIEDCVFECNGFDCSSDLYGVYLLGSDNSKVKDCEFYDIKMGIFSYDSNNFFIEDNDFSIQRIIDDSVGMRLSSCNNVNILGNSFGGSASYKTGISSLSLLNDVEDNNICGVDTAFDCNPFNGEIVGNMGGNDFSGVNVCQGGRPEEGSDYTSC